MAIAAGDWRSLARVAPPEPGLRITRIAWLPEERGIRLVWPGVAGKTYAVERSVSGVTGPYEPVATGLAAATAMRRILIERARKKARIKRGGGQRVPLAQVNVATDASPDDLLLVDEALEQFARVHPARAELVKLRFFAGLNLNKAAAVLGISEPTAKRHWAYARLADQEIERLRAAG